MCYGIFSVSSSPTHFGKGVMVVTLFDLIFSLLS